MPNFNSVTLMGNITRDIELRYLPSGSAVCEVGVAVNETWFDKATEQKKERTTFVDCTAFGRTAEVISEYLGKGKPIFLVGKLQTDSWEDKTTGQKRSKLKVVIDKIEFLGAGKGGETRGEGRQSHSGEENQDTTEPSIKQIDESESPF